MAHRHSPGGSLCTLHAGEESNGSKMCSKIFGISTKKQHLEQLLSAINAISISLYTLLRIEILYLVMVMAEESFYSYLV